MAFLSVFVTEVFRRVMCCQSSSSSTNLKNRNLPEMWLQDLWKMYLFQASNKQLRRNKLNPSIHIKYFNRYIRPNICCLLYTENANFAVLDDVTTAYMPGHNIEKFWNWQLSTKCGQRRNCIANVLYKPKFQIYVNKYRPRIYRMTYYTHITYVISEYILQRMY